MNNLPTHDIRPEDEQFYAQLKNWLDSAARDAGGSKAACYPLFFNDDHTINRERTLDLPCYMGMPVDPAQTVSGDAKEAE
jgi:hypothetical protein